MVEEPFCYVIDKICGNLCWIFGLADWRETHARNLHPILDSVSIRLARRERP